MTQEELNQELKGKLMTIKELNKLRLELKMEFNLEFHTKKGQYLMWGSGPISSENGLDDFIQADTILKENTVCFNIKAH